MDTILAYSKLEAGMLTLKDKTYNFYEMIEEQARLCLLNIREKDIVFTVRFLDRFPQQVSGDSIRVAQIFRTFYRMPASLRNRERSRCHSTVRWKKDRYGLTAVWKIPAWE